MTQPDELLAALRTACPVLDYQPSAASPEASAMLARILSASPDRPRRGRPRVIRRRPLVLLSAGLSAAAVTAVVLASVTASGPGSPPAISKGKVQAAILASYGREAGGIAYVTTVQWDIGTPPVTQQSWTYPAILSPGQRVRTRLFQHEHGAPTEDTESIYTAPPHPGRLTRPTTSGPHVAQVIDVEYATHTWSRMLTSTALTAEDLTPETIRHQVAAGRFTVVGEVHLNGHAAIELTWTQLDGGPESGTTTRYWVDARTYLPLRSVLTEWVHATKRHPKTFNGQKLRPGQTLVFSSETQNFQIIPATPANLDQLTPPIPAGFTRTAHTPHFAPYTPPPRQHKN